MSSHEELRGAGYEPLSDVEFGSRTYGLITEWRQNLTATIPVFKEALDRSDFATRPGKSDTGSVMFVKGPHLYTARFIRSPRSYNDEKDYRQAHTLQVDIYDPQETFRGDDPARVASVLLSATYKTSLGQSKPPSDFVGGAAIIHEGFSRIAMFDDYKKPRTTITRDAALNRIPELLAAFQPQIDN